MIKYKPLDTFHISFELKLKLIPGLTRVSKRKLQLLENY